MTIDLRTIAERQLEAETAYRLSQDWGKRLELLDRLDRWEAALAAAIALNARILEAEAADEASGNPAPPSGESDVRSEDT